MAKPMYVTMGSGLMGIGIATHFARHGHDMLLYDTDPSRLKEVPNTATGILKELIDAGKARPADLEATLKCLRTTANFDDVAKATLIMEAVPERIEVKRALYAKLESVVDDTAVIASNTSGLPPDELAAEMRHPERLLIAHFWNPPHFVPLVEIVPGKATKREHLAAVQALMLGMDLQAVLLERAIPGFIGNRIQFAIVREALHIVQSGVADAETVDLVIKSTFGRRYPMIGQLEVADMGGLDTFLDISRHLMPQLCKDESVLKVLEDKVAKGETGLRAGNGFYRWDDARKKRLLERRAHQLRHALEP